MPEFTDQQLDATEYRRLDACVMAGPGSGKTTVLVERFRRLLEEHQVQVHEILAITFTEKAAANLRAKLNSLFEGDDARRRELEGAWVSTIHGFCMRLLRENAIAAGLDPNFQILDPRESDSLQWECLTRALDEMTEHRREETLALIEALHAPRLSYDLKSAYDAIRSAGRSIAEVRAMPNPSGVSVSGSALAAQLRSHLNWTGRLTPAQPLQQAALLEWSLGLEKCDPANLREVLEVRKANPLHLGRVPEAAKAGLKQFREEELGRWVEACTDVATAPFRSMVFDVLERFDSLYRERKIAGARLDFNDLERHAIDLLRDNAAIRRQQHERFRQVMLDEYQDINEQQAMLIELMRGPDSFFGVGDLNQSIYGFRHARPDIFARYRDEVMAAGGHVVELTGNFRSRPEILRCAEALSQAEGVTYRELTALASFAGKSDPSIEVLKIYDPDADKDTAGEREARWIAHRIQELRRSLLLGATGETRPADFRDFAVLCRTGESMQPILREFDRQRIPYICGRRQSFLLARECVDLTALLECIENPRNTIALVTVLRSPFCGLSDEALLRLRLKVEWLHRALDIDTGLEGDDAVKLARFAENFRRWRKDQSVTAPDLLIARILDDCGFTWQPESVTGDNMESYLKLARSRGAAVSLRKFLDEVESIGEAAGAEVELSDDDAGNRVHVMTVHGAKGLEFPIVIIASAEKSARVESAPVTFTPEAGLGIKWKDPFSGDGVKDSWSEANSVYLKARETEEENRLFYVALTRAKEHLILSYTSGDRRQGRWAKRIDEHFGANQKSLSSDPPPFTPRTERQNDEVVPMVPRLAGPDQRETGVSVTSLTTFARCPRKYYLERVIGWTGERAGRRSDPEEELSAAEAGTLVHEILALKSGEQHPLADVFFNSDLGRRAAAASRVEREWAFIVEIDGAIVRGTIDLWFEEDGEIHIVDYKTDRDVKEGYGPQLALYAMALERATGRRPVKAWLHFLRPDVVEEVPLDDTRARGLLRELREAQATLRFELNVGEHCRACACYRTVCPANMTLYSA